MRPFVALLLLVGLSAVLPAQGQSEQGRLLFRSVTPEEYDGRPYNWAVAQDDRGLLYVGSDEGVVVYDGIHWARIPPLEHAVRSLAYGYDGHMYVGGIGTLGLLTPDGQGQLRYTALNERLPEAYRDFADVWYTLATPDGVYFLTEQFLARWRDGQMHVWDAGAQSYYSALFVHGEVYVYTLEHGISKVVGDALVAFTGGRPFTTARVEGIVPLDATRFLVATRSNGLFACGPGEPAAARCRPFPTEADAALRDAQIYTVARLDDGGIALGTVFGGLFLLHPDGRLRQRLSETDGLRSATVHHLFQDREGGLWLALADGLARIEPSFSRSYFDRQDGLRGDVRDLLRFDGTLYATTSLGLYRLQPGSARTPARFVRIPGSDECWTLMEMARRPLVGCSSGLRVLDGDRTAAQWDAETFIERLTRSTREPGLLYISTPTGVWWTRSLDEPPTHLPNSGRAVSKVVELPPQPQTPPYVVKLLVYSTLDGVALLTWNQRSGTVERLALGQHPLDEALGQPLFLPKAGGVQRLEQTGAAPQLVPDLRFSPPAADGPYPYDAFFAGRGGSFWASWNQQLYRGRVETSGRIQWSSDRAAWLGALGPTAVLEEATGDLWVASRNRLFHLAPDSTAHALPPLAVHLRSAALHAPDTLLFGGHGPLPPLTLVAGPWSLRLSFGAPTFIEQASPLYRIQLEGFEEQWSGWTTETYKDFTNLPPGSYRFRVQARDHLGRISPISTYEMRILPPWYQSRLALLTWFLVGLVVLVGVAVRLVRWRSHRLEMRTVQLRRLVEERTHEIKSQQQLLEMQNNQLEEANVELAWSNNELARTNQALERRTQALREALEQNKEILGITSHDLKNPLGSIIGLADLLLLEAEAMPQEPAFDPVRDFAPLIKSEGQRMLQIIKDLLDRARQGQSHELHIEPADLSDLARSALHWNQQAADRKAIQFYLDAPPTLAVHVDVHAIQRVLDNLFSNAVKYSPSGSSAWIRVWAEDGEALVSIRDEGPGMTSEDLGKVFGKLQRLSAQPTGGEHSTGLGLYVVKQLVDLHHGRVWVESTVGAGATFFVALPLAPYADPPPASVVTDEEAVSV